MEKVKIKFGAKNEPADFVKTEKPGVNPMAIVARIMSNPGMIKKILIGVAIFWIIGAVSTIYFTVLYYNVLLPIYVVIFGLTYIYINRKSMLNIIKNKFTKKN